VCWIFIDLEIYDNIERTLGSFFSLIDGIRPKFFSVGNKNTDFVLFVIFFYVDWNVLEI
jgi:hypothetical protein